MPSLTPLSRNSPALMVLERVPGVSPQKCCFQVLLAGTSCFFPAISSGEQMPAARDWLLRVSRTQSRAVHCCAVIHEQHGEALSLLPLFG